ncbi:fluoride efflux transporter CrcB [Elioraea sp.]|uniref:fluoride efflux transporter CrcB n=1 Tax=Elioraea sp. TaxID=2185103 RepID=UPI003F71A4F8
MDAVFWVVLGSALGGMARYWLSGVVGRAVGETFPWGTMVVNVSGALAIGIIAALAAAGLGRPVADHAWQLAVIGFLGSYTTVSSFSLQTLALARDGDWRRAGANTALSLGLCPAAAALGLAIGALLAAQG